MVGIYAVNSYLLVICSAGCRRVFSVFLPFFLLIFARFLLCCAYVCFCVFFVFMQNNFCIFCICKICNCILQLCKIVQNLQLHNFLLMFAAHLLRLCEYDNITLDGDYNAIFRAGGGSLGFDCFLILVCSVFISALVLWVFRALNERRAALQIKSTIRK